MYTLHICNLIMLLMIYLAHLNTLF